MIIDLNVKCKTKKFGEDIIGENQFDLRYGNDLLDITPKAWSRKERMDKLDFTKIKHFCFAKDNVKIMKQ